jgi:hypothetical protein
METMIHFAGLAVTTLFAAASAVALDWLLLRATFQLMRPATVRSPRAVRSEVIDSTRELVRQFAPQAKL